MTVARSFSVNAMQNARAAYFAVKGIDCPNCATRINDRLLATDGVLLSLVMYEQHIVALFYDPLRAKLSDLLGAVADAGKDSQHVYHAHLIAEAPASTLI